MKRAVLACALAMFAMALPSYASTVHGTNPSLLGHYALGTNWRSDVEGDIFCYDSDGDIPIYLVDSTETGELSIAYVEGIISIEGVSTDCVGHIELDRQAYNDATASGKAYYRAHEMDHERGWRHDEGRVPDHDGTRETGENAANPATMPVVPSQYSGPIY